MSEPFDPIKSEKNRIRRGLPFSMAEDFDFTTAIIREDARFDYGERRYQALGMIGDLLVLLVFTFRDGAVGVISLRKASRKERRTWQEKHP